LVSIVHILFTSYIIPTNNMLLKKHIRSYRWLKT
jgi:hypothetical protein